MSFRIYDFDGHKRHTLGSDPAAKGGVEVITQAQAVVLKGWSPPPEEAALFTAFGGDFVSQEGGKVAYSPTSGTVDRAVSDVGKTSGKYYFEIELTVASHQATPGLVPNTNVDLGTNVQGYPGNINGIGYLGSSGAIRSDDVNVQTSLALFNQVGDICGVLLDLDAGTVQFSVNGVNQGTPQALPSIDATGTWYPALGDGASDTFATEVGGRLLTLSTELNYLPVGVSAWGRVTPAPVLVALIDNHTSATAASGTASASSEYPGWEAWRAVDGTQIDPNWSSNPPDGPNGSWWQYQFSSAQTATKLTIQDRVGGGNMFTAFKLQGSNNGSDWTDLLDESGITWAAGETKEWVFTNATAYTYYRWLCVTAVDANYVDFAEIQLYGI